MRRIAVLLLLLSALLAACGADDGGTDDVASRSATTDAGESTADGDEDGGGEEDADSEEFSGKGSGDFCDKARDYDKKFENIGQNSEDAEKEWDELEDAIDDLAGDAPAEIEDDVQLVAKNFKEVKAVYEKYDYDFSKVPEEEAAAIDDEGVKEANERVNAYMETVCKIDQDGDGDTDGAEPGSEGTDDTTDSTESEQTDQPADE